MKINKQLTVLIKEEEEEISFFSSSIILDFLYQPQCMTLCREDLSKSSVYVIPTSNHRKKLVNVAWVALSGQICLPSHRTP
jgi:hypothetical protein